MQCYLLLQNKVTHAPHAALKSQPCPRDGCRGRVQDAERVTQTKRKKELEAILAAPPAIPVPTPKPSGRGRKAHQAPAASRVIAFLYPPSKSLFTVAIRVFPGILSSASYLCGVEHTILVGDEAVMRLSSVIALSHLHDMKPVAMTTLSLMVRVATHLNTFGSRW